MFPTHLQSLAEVYSCTRGLFWGKLVEILYCLVFLRNKVISGKFCIYHVYRVSQEECARLRESVAYVELYRYNPKHLYPNLNGYGDNDQRSLKLWQLLLTYWLPNTYWNWQKYVVSVMLISVLNIKVTCEWHKAIKLNYKNTRNTAAGGLEFQALCIWNAILSLWARLVSREPSQRTCLMQSRVHW